MKVLLIILGVIALCSDVTGQFTAAPPTCPGDTFTFSCTVTGEMSGSTIWRVGLGTNECTLAHTSTSSSSPCGPNSALTARPGTGFGTNGPSYSSTLSGTANPALSGTLVECFGQANNRGPENRVGNSTLQILGPPSMPTLSCVDHSEDVIGTVNVTVNWTLSGGDSADFYLINITTNAPQTPYGGLLNITTGSVTQYELTGFITGYEYNITVHGVTANCGGLVGMESEPLTITPQVPTTPTHLNVCAVYDMVKLQIIESTWNEVNPVTVSEDCANGQDIRANYELSYTTDSGTLNTTCAVDGTECSNGRCRHELQNNTTDSRCQPPLSQFSGEDVTVSVTARNIVWRRNPAVSRSINGRNIDLEVFIDTATPTNAFVECTFFQQGYTCTIDYGTDPSYTNLVYRDNSSTQGRRTTIILSQRLREDTTYYYIVSAESSSQCVRVRRRFQTGCSKADLIHESGTTNPARCIDRGFVNSSFITDGVVCYNGTAVGSRAIYICNSGYKLMEVDKATRVCQSDGSWNSSIPQCIPKEGDQTSRIVGGVVGSGVLLIVIGVIAIIIIIISYRRCKSNSPREVDENTMNLIDNTGTDTNNDGRTPLHNAAEQGDVDKLKNLLGQGFDVNIKQKDGRTPLHTAAEQSDVNTVKTLLGQGADTTIKDKNGMTPLHVAAERGHLEIVRCLANVEGAPINVEDKNGWSPLHIAAREGQNVIMEILVDNGADVSMKDNDDRTPLHLAAEKVRRDIMEYLVKKGTDINIKDNEGWTPLHMVARGGYENTVEFIVKQGADINIQDEKGQTPLHIASRKGYVKTVERLVKLGADLSIKDGNGMVPLHVAAEAGRHKIVGFLFGGAVDINMKDDKGRTPLHIASKEGYQYTTECLVDKGADINMKDDEGMKPLEVANERGHVKIVNFLRDEEGKTSE